MLANGGGTGKRPSIAETVQPIRMTNQAKAKKNVRRENDWMVGKRAGIG